MSVLTATKKPPLAPLTTAINPTVVLLGAATLVGAVAGIWRLAVGLGSATALSDAYPWGIWIGFDFTLVAFSGAGFTMAALVFVLRQEKFRPALRPAIMAGLLGYVAVLLLLVLDLGRWDRFYHFLIYWNIHSPLFEVSWCISLYTLVLVVETSPQIFERLNQQKLLQFVHRYVIPLAVIGLTLSSLHQSTLGTLYLNMPHRLHPLWYTPILPLFFFISSIMAGLSLAMIAYFVATRIRGRAAQPEIARGLATGTAWVTLVYVLLKLGDLWLAGELSRLWALDQTSELMWLEMGPGAVLPMILFFHPTARANHAMQWTGAMLILFGVLVNRFNATLFAQLAPDWTSYSPHPLEWLSTLGVISGAVMAWYLGVRYLAVFDEQQG